MRRTDSSERGVLCAEFLSSGGDPLFVMVRQPQNEPRGCVLVVPPFAEEMNKSRRLVTELGFALATSGVALAMPDLSGTGDSSGDFAEATWATWLADLARTREWLECRGLKVSGLLAIRLGAALACDALRSGALHPVQRTVLCQPVFDGKRHLQQFLRLRVAASRMIGSTESLEMLRSVLASGSTVEVAGYVLSPALASAMELAVFPERLPDAFGEVDWVEIVRGPSGAVSPHAAKFMEHQSEGGVRVRAHAAAGEPFWGTTEVVVDPTLLAILSNCLSGGCTGPTEQTA